jgi:purine-binding chemotaxis protein CheW
MDAQDTGSYVQPPGSTDKDGTSTGKIQVVEFRLGKEQYAIDLSDIREVVEYSSITRVPDMPPCMKGVIDLRGEITSIVDLNQRLNINPDPSKITHENQRIIVLDEKHTSIKTGIIVDEVSSVSTYDQNAIDRTSSSLNLEDSVILGIIRKKMIVRDKTESQLVIWIDIRKILETISSTAKQTPENLTNHG